jgi:hypothetical protein
VSRKGLRLRIGPYTYRQRWVSQKELGDAAADCDAMAKCIRLCDTTDHVRALENLVHEVVEVVNYEAELQLEHWKIQALGLLMTQALQPILRKWW